MRRFHTSTVGGQVMMTECRAVDCPRDHVYELDIFEGRALRDLIDERRMTDDGTV